MNIKSSAPKAIALFASVAMTFNPGRAQNDQCDGGAIKTHDAYLYGRFETRMKSTEGSGIVSSFFLYNWDLNCNWPQENNEIDIEMTGNLNQSVQFTTHHPYQSSVTEIVPVPFNPHETMVDYAIEWEPNVVRWFINGELSHEVSHSYIPQLQYPMRIFMNLWAVEALTWTGEWDPTAMPGLSRYDFVRYHAYTPGTGNTGTGNNFTLEWSDDFNALDATRWDRSEDGNVGPLCTFRAANVEVSGGELHLSITVPEPTVPTRPVTFGVDVSALDLSATDVVYIAGGFTNWCASCQALSDPDGDDVWTTTMDLPLGSHEFQFAINGWGGAIAKPELGSNCDYNPCDEYTNYGVSVDEEMTEVYAPLHCWNTCALCGDLSPSIGCLGDFDNDLSIGVNDILSLLPQFGCMTSCTHDLNGDGAVGVGDVLLLLGAFGEVCP